MIDIGIDEKYKELSNFTERQFFYEDIKCNSIEGLLQGLKFKDVDKQKEICLLVGRKAKNKGRKKKWYKDNHTLYLKGEPISRFSETYSYLLYDIYREVYSQDKSFRQLIESIPKKEELKHSCGINNKCYTVLTEEEFVYCLNRLRIIQNKGEM